MVNMFVSPLGGGGETTEKTGILLFFIIRFMVAGGFSCSFHSPVSLECMEGSEVF